MTVSHPQAPLFLPIRAAWWKGLLLSLSVGGLFYVAADRTIEHDARERFGQQARNAQYSIAARIKAYTDVLRGTASYFQSCEHVSRTSFHRYVAGLDLPIHFAALDNINYTEFVRDEEREAFERAYRDAPDAGPAGYPRSITLLPAGRRPSYSVITLMEPIEIFGEKIGLDITAKPRVAEALEHSRDYGGLSASGSLIDSSHKSNRPWLAMRLPIYRNGMPMYTVAQRRAAYRGSVGIGFSVHGLVQSALDEMPEHQTSLRLYDGGELNQQLDPAPEALLFDSRAGKPAAKGAADAPSFDIMLPLNFNGRLWKAYFSAPQSEWIRGFDTYLPWLAMLTGFTGSVLFCLLYNTLASSRQRAIQLADAMTRELRESQSRLQQSHQKLRGLVSHADQIKEEERKRIAREIHDDLGQNLLALRIDADLLAGRTRGRHPRLHARAVSTRAQIDSTIKSVRNIINDLRPTVLDLGLGAAVEWQIAQFRQRSGIACELIERDSDLAISDHCATALFRVLQESLSNIQQHAKASQARVELAQSGGMLRMTISDNGVGLPETSRNKVGSFGLVGIEERISILGGACTISGTPNAGTIVTVLVPLTPVAQGLKDLVH
jgi:signal transduction histidine kinase